MRYALSIPNQEVWDAHRTAKRQMIQHVNRASNAGMDVDILTLGFARRATAYMISSWGAYTPLASMSGSTHRSRRSKPPAPAV